MQNKNKSTINLCGSRSWWLSTFTSQHGRDKFIAIWPIAFDTLRYTNSSDINIVGWHKTVTKAKPTNPNEKMANEEIKGEYDIASSPHKIFFREWDPMLGLAVESKGESIPIYLQYHTWRMMKKSTSNQSRSL